MGWLSDRRVDCVAQVHAQVQVHLTRCCRSTYPSLEQHIVGLRDMRKHAHTAAAQVTLHHKNVSPYNNQTKYIIIVVPTQSTNDSFGYLTHILNISMRIDVVKSVWKFKVVACAPRDTVTNHSRIARSYVHSDINRSSERTANR